MAISLIAYVATFLGQLYFRRSYFFIPLQSNYFNTKDTFSEQLFLQCICFFWRVLFSEQPILRSSYFFRIATFFRAKLLASSHHLRTVLEKTNFSEKQYSTLPNLSGELLFGAATFSKDVIFYDSYLFSRAIPFHNILFHMSYHFTATFPFHSYTSYLAVNN